MQLWTCYFCTHANIPFDWNHVTKNDNNFVNRFVCKHSKQNYVTNFPNSVECWLFSVGLPKCTYHCCQCQLCPNCILHNPWTKPNKTSTSTDVHIYLYCGVNDVDHKICESTCKDSTKGINDALDDQFCLGCFAILKFETRVLEIS